MFKNYLKIAFRNLRKDRAYSFINITGLSIGIASCIMILLFIKSQLGYDSFYKYSDQIYRVATHELVNNATFNTALTPAPLGEELRRDYPQVVNYTRINRSFITDYGYPIVKYGDKVFSEKHFFLADSTFFGVFNLPFIKGDPQKALSQPNSVVITESTAKKYFGNINPIGKMLNVDQNKDFMVTGVVKDVPANSHFHFDLLGSLCSYSKNADQDWLTSDYYTYIILRKGVDINSFKEKLKNVVQKYVDPQISQVAVVNLSKMRSEGRLKWDYFLQPVTSIHLHSHLESELEANGDITYIYIFSAVALLILLIACINFMNLSTARSERRAKEVGIRKTLGSNIALLVGQFFTESIMMSFIAFAIAVSLVEILMPLFNNISGQNIKPDSLLNLGTVPLLIGIAIIVGILAGGYPAFYLSRFHPALILRNSRGRGTDKSWLRNTLVVFQFSVSIVLFIGTFMIYSQLNYMQNINLGLDKENVIIINRTNNLDQQIQSFKHELLSNPDILHVSNSTTVPGYGFSSAGCRIGDTPGNQTRIIMTMGSDENFAKTYKIKMAEGRYFSKEFPSDTSAVVLNEAAVSAFGVKNPVGKELIKVGQTPSQRKTYKIIGVTKNFNYESLRGKIRPLAIHMLPDLNSGRFVSVRVSSNDYPALIAFMKSKWEEFAGEEAFNYDFLDQHLDQLYSSSQKTGKISTIFSVLAILISSLGLLGLAAFVTEQKTKEIGIRKVLGASTPEIVYLLSKEFAKWVVLANLIAWPVAYFLMKNWLQNFAYRINMNIWVFIAAGVGALIVAFVTISFHAVKAALANPIDSLQYE